MVVTAHWPTFSLTKQERKDVRRYLFLLSFLAIGVAYGKHISWSEGVLVLRDHQVLVGEVVIEPALNVVLFRAEGSSTFYATEKVDYVVFHDPIAGLNRMFLARQSSGPSHPSTELYEVVLRGPLSVLRKPKGSRVPALTDVNSFDYYIVSGESVELVKLSQFNRKVLPIIESHFSKTQLKEIVRAQKLNLGRMSDTIRLIQYYNDWSTSTASAK